MKRVMVIGAGVGGLTTGAMLAKEGMDVTVLEAHIYPGGCAGTFYHQGYRFDAGATLAAGFYPGGPMDLVAQATGVGKWDARPSNPTMVVHLPDGTSIPRWSDERRWGTRRDHFGEDGVSFFRWQEATADALWDFALRVIPWPPQTTHEVGELLNKTVMWGLAKPSKHFKPGLVADALKSTKSRLPNANDRLRLFIDGQLLISAQTVSERANALYSASALDLPRRGAVHIPGGMGTIAEKLAQALNSHGGRLLMRKRVVQVKPSTSGSYQAIMERGDPYEADIVIFNLPLWNIRKLLDPPDIPALRNLPSQPDRGWGAFMVYLGVEQTAIPEDFPLHHQIIQGRPLAEGNSLFLSISPAWDTQRAPAGKRAITISTHTQLRQWWDLHARHPEQYEFERQRLQDHLLTAIETRIPGIKSSIDFSLDATPITFSYFTGRASGWVGGYPQINLFQTKSPRLARDLWMVGDSIFPGQSTAAVALGGLRVAKGVLKHV